MENLRDDIDFLIHDQIAIVENIELYLSPIKEILFEGDDYPEEVNKNYLYKKLEKRIALIINLNEELMSFLKTRNNFKEHIGYINVFNDSINSYLKSRDEINATYIYDKLIRLEKNLNLLRKEKIPNSSFKEIKQEIKYVKKIIAIYFMHQSEKLIAHFKEKSNNFKELIKNNEENIEILPFDIISLLEGVLRNFQFKSDVKKLKIERNYSSHLRFFVEGNRPSILRSLDNIIHNAIKYSRTLKNYEVWIGLKIHEKNSFIIIEVENWGIGILPKEINEGLIFKKGYRGEFAKSNNIEGTGMGLSYARKEIMKSGGELLIGSRLAKSHETISKSANFITTTIVKLRKI